MRSVYLWACLLVSLLCPFGMLSAVDIRSTIQAREDSVDFPEADLYSNIYADQWAIELERICDPSDIQIAEELMSQILIKLQNSYYKLRDAETLAVTEQLYERLRSKHELVDSYDDTRIYCVVKRVIFQIQDQLRSTHLALLEQYDLMNDFGGFSDEVWWAELKKDLLDGFIEEKANYVPSKVFSVPWSPDEKKYIKEDFTFEVRNPSFRDDLSSAQEELLDRTLELMKRTVYAVLHQLIDEKVFDVFDVEQLEESVVFEYVDSCDTFHGRYEVEETFEQNGTRVGLKTNELLLKVNLCSNYFILRDLDEIVEKIVVHELGHHFYYYHDPDPGDFEAICWVSDIKKRSSCEREDFVSDYATTMAVEDYAEQFMYWQLDLTPEQGISTLMERKFAHFRDIR